MADSSAYQSLRENQTQIDDTGEMVAVSRQALDEVLDHLDEAREALEMFDSDWTKTEMWRRQINGISLAIRKAAPGKFEWRASRYHPGLDERGEAETVEQAMEDASSVAK